jgi:hypothetical protein
MTRTELENILVEILDSLDDLIFSFKELVEDAKNLRDKIDSIDTKEEE